MKKYYIYLITNVINDKKYVGKSASEIRNKYLFGKYGFVKLAKEYNVGQTTIRKIISRKTWSHI